jgi:DNA protecting protein DprA
LFNMNEEILYIWLSLIDGIGPVLGSELLGKFKDVKSIYEATYKDILEVKGIGDKLARNIVNSKNLMHAGKIYDYCIKEEINILKKYKENYPTQLNYYINSPIVLYAKGILKESSDSVAIVGSRRCTEYGKKVTIELATELSKTNIPIISGLAKGIDGYSHTVAIKNNSYTIGVIGTGINICYPKEHIKLMESIFEKGLVISQFPPGTKNIKQNFIKRNELIAMLAKKIVVIQAGKDSGALYTAKCGMKYNKEVFAVPNNIYDNFSLGTNELIFQGAKVYISSKMITSSSAINEVKYNTIELCKMNEDEIKICNLIKSVPLTLDQLKINLNISLMDIQEILLEMELKGYIEQKRGIYMLSSTI